MKPHLPHEGADPGRVGVFDDDPDRTLVSAECILVDRDPRPTGPAEMVTN